MFVFDQPVSAADVWYSAYRSANLQPDQLLLNVCKVGNLVDPMASFNLPNVVSWYDHAAYAGVIDQGKDIATINLSDHGSPIMAGIDFYRGADAPASETPEPGTLGMIAAGGVLVVTGKIRARKRSAADPAADLLRTMPAGTRTPELLARPTHPRMNACTQDSSSTERWPSTVCATRC
ncbi:MAG: hypothetical protein HY822_00195 [Acidobacteria bacterium]|nr:hypothetical protein [Acidobacteriota bacterium]